MRIRDLTRYETIFDKDKVIVDVDLPLESRPDWDIFKNNHFALRRKCLNVFLKFGIHA